MKRDLKECWHFKEDLENRAGATKRDLEDFVSIEEERAQRLSYSMKTDLEDFVGIHEEGARRLNWSHEDGSQRLGGHSQREGSKTKLEP